MARVLRFLVLVAVSVAIVVLAVWVGLRRIDDMAKPATSSDFVRAEGRGLIRDGAPFRFRAVAFANDYDLELGDYGFTLATSRHHRERDFARVADLGFNAVRFALNATWYRDDPRAFWRWLDRNVGWARDNGVLLILDLHVPIGGTWLDASDPAPDFSIWTDPEVAAENVAFWLAIAERYRYEPTIAAYDLLNEPVTADATGAAWRQLAAEMVRAVRSVDPNHLLIVAPVYGKDRSFEPVGPEDQFLVDDRNAMYDFHFYEPIAFTHQTAAWLVPPILDGGRYPDPEVIVPTGAQVQLLDSSLSGPTLVPGDSGWQRYEGDWVAITDPRAVAALPIATMRAGARGSIRFDEIEVFEHDVASDTIRRVVHAPLEAGDLAKWWEWGEVAPQSYAGHFTRDTTDGSGDGAGDGASLGIDGDTARVGFLGWSSDDHWFRITPGNRYRIAGSMKGRGVAYGPPGTGGDEPGFIGFTLDVYGSPDDGTPGFVTRGPDQLAFLFHRLARFGLEHDVPVSVMEFGTIRATLDDPNKGGADWIADMLDLLDANDTSYALWNYHGAEMGLFRSVTETWPSRPNRPLLDVVEAHLAGSAP